MHRDRRAGRGRRPARRARSPLLRSARARCPTSRPSSAPSRHEIASAAAADGSASIASGVVGDEAARATAVASVLGGRLAWDAVFRDLSRVLPANVWLTKLSVTQPQARQPGRRHHAAVAAAAVGQAATPTAVSIDGFTYTQTDVARLLARLATVPSLRTVTLTSSQAEPLGREDSHPLRHRRRPESDRRSVMSALLRLAHGESSEPACSAGCSWSRPHGSCWSRRSG